MKFIISAIALTVLSAFAVIGNKSSTARELSASEVSVSKSDKIKVMSYNIHHCNPPSKADIGEIDLDAIVKVIQAENPDLVALQEVDVNTKRSGNVNQAEAIAKKLNMHFFFGKAINHDGGEYGVAVLSKYPITEPKVYPLPSDADPKAEPRVLTTCKVALPKGRTVVFASTHLDVRNNGNRELQVKTIQEIASKEAIPFIIAGDFNAKEQSTPIKLFDENFERTCSNCEPTIPVINPNRAIDYIAFTRSSPFKVISHKVIPERYASDHLPIVAVLKF